MDSIIKKQARVDLLNGPIFTSMIRFAIPVLLSSIFQQLYNTMDTIIVGNILGEVSLAAVGAAMPVYDLLMGFAMGMGHGLSIVTARSFGSGNKELLKKSVGATVKIGAVIAIVITVLTRVVLFPFLELLHTPMEIINESYSYVSFITMFSAVTLAYNLCSGALRAIGNSVMPLVFLIISSLINIVLDILFIAQFHMGIRGAAAATVIAQAISVILCFIYIVKRTPLLVPEKRHFETDKALYKEMVAQGLSMSFMSCFVSAGTAVLQTGINGLGYLVIAGHTAARKLCMFCLMPYSAMHGSINTFVSQNYGAGKPERIRKAMKYAYCYNALVTGILVIVLYSFAPQMVSFISGSDEAVVLGNGARYLRVVAPFYFVLGVVTQTRSALQAIGRKILPILSSVIELVGKIVFAMIFIPIFQYGAVIWCEPIIWCFMAVELVIAFWTNPYVRKSGREAI